MKKVFVALVIILIVGIAIAYAQNPGMMGGQGVGTALIVDSGWVKAWGVA